MSLLDDVSIVVTPNGYKAGTLFAVKPTDVLGSEEITNGDFSNELTDWTENGGSYATIVSGALNSNNPDAGNWYAENISQNVSFVNGTTYKLTFKAKNISGNLNLRITQGANPMASLDLTSTFVDYTYFYTANADNGSIRIFCNSAVGQFQIDDISVKEVTGADMDVTRATAATRVDENGLVNYAEIIGGEEITNGDFATDTDWTKGTGWTISGGNGVLTSGSGILTQTLSGVIVSRSYKLSWETGLNFQVRLGGANIGYFSGSNSLIISSAAGTLLEFLPNGTQTGTLDNVSIKEAARDNVPRIDYTGGGCPHILAEPQRTNLIAYSEDFSDSSWSLDGSNVNLTRTPNATTSPSGEENATKLIGNNISNDPNNSYIGVNTSAAAPYITSIFAKKGEYDYLVSGIGSYAGGYYAIFNLSNGTVSTSPTASGTTASIEDYGNGWYRCLVNTTNTGGGELLFISPSVDGTLTTNYTNTTNGIYVWGGQLEQGSYPTSYIPTSGSTVTRNQDIFTRDGIGSLINSTEGVLFVEMAAFSNDGTNRTIALSDGTGNNLVRLYFSNSSNRIVAQVKVGGSTQVTFDITGITVIDFNKVALKYKENDFSIWINGVERGTDTSGTTPTSMNRLALDNGSGSENLFGKVKQLQVYTTALTDTQLAALTS